MQSSVVHVNGLELTLHVSANPIMKFIYTSCKCIIVIVMLPQLIHMTLQEGLVIKDI